MAYQFPTIFVAYGDRLVWIAKPRTVHDLIDFCYNEFHVEAHDESVCLIPFIATPDPNGWGDMVEAEVDATAWHALASDTHITCRLVANPHFMDDEYVPGPGHHSDAIEVELLTNEQIRRRLGIASESDSPSESSSSDSDSDSDSGSSAPSEGNAPGPDVDEENNDDNGQNDEDGGSGNAPGPDVNMENSGDNGHQDEDGGPGNAAGPDVNKGNNSDKGQDDEDNGWGNDSPAKDTWGNDNKTNQGWGDDYSNADTCSSPVPSYVSNSMNSPAGS